MERLETKDIAEVAANLEQNFNNSVKFYKNEVKTIDSKINIQGKEYKILDILEFDSGIGSHKSDKGIAFLDNDGNIYVHFNGTGDLNWEYNAVAYSGGPSPLQTQAAEWFDKNVEKWMQQIPEGKKGNLYVSGHSQGGNNAQYVTVCSQKADYITNCISLDGPGFSEEFVKDAIVDCGGKEAYDRRRNKIYAYNGENDYVSCLGMVSIIPDEHTTFVAYTHPENDQSDIVNYHMIDGMLKDGKLVIKEPNDDSEFRKCLVQRLEKVKELPDDKRAKAAVLVMKMIDNFEEAKVDFSDEEKDELMDILGPLLVDMVEDSPKELIPVLQGCGLDEKKAEIFVGLIEHFNSYSKDFRERTANTILQLGKACLKYKDGEFGLDDVPELLAALPEIAVELFRIAAGEGQKVLEDVLKNIDDKIVEWVQNDQLGFMSGSFAAFVVLPVLSLLRMGVASGIVLLETFGKIAEVVLSVIQNAKELVKNVKTAVLNLYTALKNAVNAFAQWLRNTFNAGVRYVRNNPYFKADTAKLRNYATRINNVNNRLKKLDSGLNSLYTQVGLLDLWDILCANLLTGGSPTLNQVRNYLNNVADRLDTAENKARGYIGG